MVLSINTGIPRNPNKTACTGQTDELGKCTRHLPELASARGDYALTL